MIRPVFFETVLNTSYSTHLYK